MGLNNLIFIGEIGRNLFFTYIRQICAVMFATLYKMIGLFLEVVYSVAGLDNSSIFTGLYEGVQDRFYVIIGIFMLFKVIMSLITYFANPDKITDKEMGAGKLVTRFITVLILLIIVPQYVFPFLSRIQAPLLSTIGKVILNSNTAMGSDGELNSGEAINAGETIANTIFAGFFTKNEDCSDDVEEEEDDDDDENNVTITDGILDTAVTMAGEACSDSKDTYKYKFNIVGAILCVLPILVLLFVIGIQVAIRAFKLILLKMIAPVPIISYLDPKSGKDGGRTSVYVKMFMTTYLDLLIHFGALFFAIEIIKLCTANFGDSSVGFLKLAGETKIFGLVFVIIGVLLFAFQAPKFLKKALGIKDSEFGSGLAGLLTTTAATAGMIGSGVAGYKAAVASPNSGNFIQNFGSGISSAISGARAGYRSAGDKSDFTKVLGGIRAKNAEIAADKAAGVTMSHRARELFYSTLAGEGKGAAMKRQVDDWDQLTKAHDAYSEREKKEATKGKYGPVSLGATDYMRSLGFDSDLTHYDSTQGRDVNYGSMTGKSKDLKGVLEQAKAAGRTTFDFGGMTGVSVSEGDFLISELEKREQAVFRDKLQSGDTAYTNGNAFLFSELESIKSQIDRAGVGQIQGVDLDTIKDGFKRMDDQMKLIKADSTRTKNEAEYIAALAASKKNK